MIEYEGAGKMCRRISAKSRTSKTKPMFVTAEDYVMIIGSLSKVAERSSRLGLVTFPLASLG